MVPVLVSVSVPVLSAQIDLEEEVAVVMVVGSVAMVAVPVKEEAGSVVATLPTSRAASIPSALRDSSCQH